MSVGRLLLRKFPIRYPDHLTFTTPGKMRRWLADGFRITEAFHLPFRALPFAANLYHFVVAERSMSKPRVVVLGAGPAGMSAAWRLSELAFR